MIWVRRGVRIIVFLILLTFAIIYGGTALLLGRSVNADLPAIAAATDPAEIAEGARMSHILGCQSCHGAGATGRFLRDDIAIGRIAAPSLARIAQGATDGQLARAIRHGVGTDSRGLYGMPTEALNALSDQDVARLIGWMRALPLSMKDLINKSELGPLGRIAILTGRLPSSIRLEGGQQRTRPQELGRYLAAVSCGQCHAADQDRPVGLDDQVAPALAPLAAAHDATGFKALLRGSGIKAHRPLPMTNPAAREGLHALSDAEIAAVQAALKAGAAGGAMR
jgi:cytochrome c553